MVGNSSYEPPSTEPRKPMTIKATIQAWLAIIGFVFACGAGVVAYAAHLIGYF